MNGDEIIFNKFSQYHVFIDLYYDVIATWSTLKTFICSKLTIKTLGKGMKYVQS